MKIKTGDKVLIISGKDKGKKSKITKSLPSVKKIVAEGINIKKKHARPKKEGQKGQTIQVAMPINISNVKLICPKCERPTRVAHKRTKSKRKIRICKKCKAELS